MQETFVNGVRRVDDVKARAGAACCEISEWQRTCRFVVVTDCALNDTSYAREREKDSASTSLTAFTRIHVSVFLTANDSLANWVPSPGKEILRNEKPVTERKLGCWERNVYDVRVCMSAAHN